MIHDYRRHIIIIVWKMYSSRDNSGKSLSKSKHLKSIRASKLYKKRRSFVNLTTEDHNYCHRSIKNHSYSAFKTTESKIQGDSDSECQNEETIRQSDINFICATQNLPTDLVDLDYSRLIVELGVLAKQFDRCSSCSKPLHLSNSLGVKPAGVTEILYAQCPDCGLISKMFLGKTHRTGGNVRGRRSFDINIKVTTGIISCLYFIRI